MDCNLLSNNIAEMEVIGRIFMLGLISAIAILTGYYLIDRVSKKQAEENLEHIKEMREAIKALTKDGNN